MFVFNKIFKYTFMWENDHKGRVLKDHDTDRDQSLMAVQGESQGPTLRRCLEFEETESWRTEAETRRSLK